MLARALDHFAGMMRHGHFKDRLCQVDGDACILMHDRLCFSLIANDFGTSMLIKLREESISSLERDAHRVRAPQR